MKSRNQSYIIYLLLFIAIVAMIYFNIQQQPSSQGPLTISQVAQQVEAGNITRIVVKDDNSLTVISGQVDSAIEQTARKEPETTLVSQLLALGVTPEQLAKVSVEVTPPSPWAGVLTLAYLSLAGASCSAVCSGSFSARRRAAIMPPWPLANRRHACSAANIPLSRLKMWPG